MQQMTCMKTAWLRPGICLAPRRGSVLGNSGLTKVGSFVMDIQQAGNVVRDGKARCQFGRLDPEKIDQPLDPVVCRPLDLEIRIGCACRGDL